MARPPYRHGAASWNGQPRQVPLLGIRPKERCRCTNNDNWEIRRMHRTSLRKRLETAAATFCYSAWRFRSAQTLLRFRFPALLAIQNSAPRIVCHLIPSKCSPRKTPLGDPLDRPRRRTYRFSSASASLARASSWHRSLIASIQWPLSPSSARGAKAFPRSISRSSCTKLGSSRSVGPGQVRIERRIRNA